MYEHNSFSQKDRLAKGNTKTKNFMAKYMQTLLRDVSMRCTNLSNHVCNVHNTFFGKKSFESCFQPVKHRMCY